MPSSGIASHGPMMPKIIGGDMPWTQSNENEKTERTHEIVRTLLYKLQEMEKQLNQVSNNLNQHSHDKDGDTVIARKLGRDYPSVAEEPVYPQTVSGRGLMPTLSNDPDAYF